LHAAEEHSAPAPPTYRKGGASSREGAGPIQGIDARLRAFLDEDVGTGDVTTEALVDPTLPGRARLRLREEGVVAGLAAFTRVFQLLDPAAVGEPAAEDGQRLRAGCVACEVRARAASLLMGERTALNLVQRLSGIATFTRRFVEAAGPGGARIYDTRKTTPGLRILEKEAVRAGGGENHRLGLFDEAMIKNNHVDVAGEPLRVLVGRLRRRHGPDLVIHAEARDEAEARDAVAGGADVVLLDNMDTARMAALCPELRAAARGRARPLEIEASGGVTLDTVAAVAASGVDRVSVGALTHSAPALDLSLSIEVLR